MDPFVQFNLVIVNASTGAPTIARNEVVRERVDLIARQFRDFLAEGDPADTSAHGLSLSADFKIRRKVSGPAAWLSFMVDAGDGKTEDLREVAKMLLLRESSPEARELLSEHAPTFRAEDLPALPAAVVIQTAAKIPLIIRDWYPKVAAGFFSPAR